MADRTPADRPPEILTSRPLHRAGAPEAAVERSRPRREKRVARRLLEVCRERPEQTALVDAEPCQPEASIDYETLDRESGRIAGALGAQEIRPDEPILIFFSNRTFDLVRLLGIWRAGAVAVPVHRSSVAATVEHIVESTGARLALGWDDTAQARVPPTAFRSGDLVVMEREPPAPREELRGGLLVVFTSGSTGVPKGVVLSDDGFAGKLDAIDEVLSFREGARTLLVLQLNFSFAQWVSLLTLGKGGTVFMLRKFAPEPFMAALHLFDIDLTAVVPTMLRAALPRLEEAGEGDLRRLQQLGCPRLIVAGGEPLPPDLGRRYRALLPTTGLTDVYGLTETCTSDFIVPPDEYDERPGSIGFPTPGVRFRIADPETGELVDPGEVGELEIATPFAMTAYLGAADLTRASYHDGYFRTGDLARMDADGCVWLAGRIKDVIIRGGNKISPLEIDHALGAHPHVRACLTTGIEDPLLGQRIHTLVVPGEKSPRGDELRAWLTERLDKFKVPDRIHFASEIPQGRTGKADRRALREWIDRGGAPATL